MDGANAKYFQFIKPIKLLQNIAKKSMPDTVLS